MTHKLGLNIVHIYMYKPSSNQLTIMSQLLFNDVDQYGITVPILISLLHKLYLSHILTEWILRSTATILSGWMAERTNIMLTRSRDPGEIVAVRPSAVRSQQKAWHLLGSYIGFSYKNTSHQNTSPQNTSHQNMSSTIHTSNTLEFWTLFHLLITTAHLEFNTWFAFLSPL